MGTFVTNPLETLFADKSPAPGLALPEGWTTDNVGTAANLNDLRDAAYDLRTAVIAAEGDIDTLEASVAALSASLTAIGTVTTTPTASAVPRAGGAGTLAAGWLPEAGAAAAGIVTTGVQTLAGNKTFSGNVAVTGNLNVDSGTLLADAATNTVTVGGALDAGSGTMHVDPANGNVGIGTGAPGRKLDVVGIIRSTSGGIELPDGTVLASAADVGGGGSATVTPTPDSIPLADGSGFIDDGWLSSNIVKDSNLFTTSTPNAVVQADGSGKISDGWLSSLVQVNSTPAVSIGATSTPSSFNLTTEGTADWMDSNGLTSYRPSSTTAIIHAKLNGDRQMWRTLEFFAGGATGVSLTAATDSPFTKSTTASDDTHTAALSATTYTHAFTATAAQTGYGFQFDVPAKATSRVVNLYCGVFSGTITITCTLRSGTTTSTTITAGAGTSTQKKVPITFTGKNESDILRVKVALTTNSGSSPNVQFYCATLT